MSRSMLAVTMTAMTAMTATMAITACSSSSSTAKPPASSAPPAAASSAPASGGGASVGGGSGPVSSSTITSNWEKFFKGSTPNAQRVSLLQNGSTFAKTISGMSAMGTTASAKVKPGSIKLTTPKQATLTYTVYLGNKPALPGAKGVAVLENGTWKVSDASFCQLLTLENGGKPPSVCSSAS